MSRPSVARQAKVKRSASVPNAGMPSGNCLARGRFDRAAPVSGPCRPVVRFSMQRVERDAVDQVERVEDVALRTSTSSGLRRRARAPWMYTSRNGTLPVKCSRHHDHARDPEEDDVEAGDQHRGGQVEIVARRSIACGCPAQPSVENGTQRRREPGVENVFVAAQRACLSAAARVCGASPRPLRARGDVDVAFASSYHAGIRWPHQSWREMHQSWMFVSHWL